LSSATSRHFKKYNQEHYYTLIDNYIIEEEENIMNDNIEKVELLLNTLPIEEYKKSIFKDRWSMNGTSISKKFYKEIEKKHKVKKYDISNILKEVLEALKNKIFNMKYHEELKTFKETNQTLTHAEAVNEFKSIWNVMKSEDITLADIVNVDIPVETEEVDEEVEFRLYCKEFYLKNINGRSQIVNASEFANLFEKLCGYRIKSKEYSCSYCMTRNINIFKNNCVV